MELLKIFAKDIELHDVIGEGQEIWCKVTSENVEDGVIQVYWGGIQSWRTKVEYKPFDIITVLRR